MSILSKIEGIFVPFAHRTQEAIGDVVFSFTGVMTSDVVNQAIFYALGAFTIYLVWLLIKPAESVYTYRPHH